jgi:hypothetical protein
MSMGTARGPAGAIISNASATMFRTRAIPPYSFSVSSSIASTSDSGFHSSLEYMPNRKSYA